MCTCQFCKDYKEYRKILVDGDIEDLRRLLTVYFERCNDVEADLEYHKAILDGSWPSAKDHAYAILSKVERRELAAKVKIEA